jgi:hypothetical protein
LNEADICLPAVQQQIDAWDPDYDVDISAMVKKYELNMEQACAFCIVA